MNNFTEWKPHAAIQEVDGYETWTHTAPHEINDDEVDGDIDLSDVIDDDD